MYFFKVVNATSRLSLQLLTGLAVILPCLSAVAQTHLTPGLAPETLVFLEFEDRTADPLITRLLTLGIRPSGEFHVGYKQVDEKGAPINHKEIVGQLDTTEIDQLNATLPTIELVSTSSEKMNIGYSTDLTRGWLGILSLSRDGMNQSVGFTSLRPASHPTRSVALNRLVTFIFDLKNLALRKIKIGGQ